MNLRYLKSIRVKIGGLVLLCVLSVSFIIGFASIQSARRVVERDSSQLMQSMSTEKAETLEALLSRIGQSVQTLSDFAESALTDVGRFQTSPDYVRQYTEQLTGVTVNAAKNTEGAMAVYVRYNPDFTDPTSGLFYSRSSASGSFEKLIPTDFSMYDPSDSAHVGWYYIPVRNGKPTWMAPYVNENLGVKMISYVIPLTINGVNMGVVGMDIDFSVVTDIVDNTRIYQTGYAFLSDENSERIYQPSSTTPGNGSWKQIESPLSNGMRLGLTAPAREINADADSLMWRICLIVIIGIAATLLISSAIISGIVKPLRDLNRAAGEIAEGKLDVLLACQSQDEVGMLAVSFGRTVDRLKNYLSCIRETAAVLYQLAHGELAIHLEQEYAGEFAQIKEALLTISNGLNQDVSRIQRAAQQVAVGAGQVASSAQVLSHGASEQTQAIEELAILTRELVDKAKANAEGARAVHELAGKAEVDLQQNGDEMAQMVQAMERISSSGDQIISMTKAIDGIARQTSILALNASIEAARAGVAGRGFSIVAEEVKNLAVKSTETAEEITALVQDTVSAIADGSRIAVETERSVMNTAEGARNVVQIVQQIVTDSDEQVSTVNRVFDSMDRISSVVQQASAASEESAASSEELSGQAQMVRELTEKFHLSQQDLPDGLRW